MSERYPYWMVTRGRSPATARRRGLAPLAVVEKASGRRALYKAVEQRLRASALAFDPQPNAMDMLRAISSRYMASALSDLWLSEVRLAASGAVGRVDEETIEWVVLDFTCHRLPEPWQGPADPVIQAALPVTIRPYGVLAPYEAEVLV